MTFADILMFQLYSGQQYRVIMAFMFLFHLSLFHYFIFLRTRNKQDGQDDLISLTRDNEQDTDKV